MSTPEANLECVLLGGPGDGATLAVGPGVHFVLVTIGVEVHGYQLTPRTEKTSGRWALRWTRRLAVTCGGRQASEVLGDRPHFPLAVKPVPLSEVFEPGEGGAQS